MSHFNIDFFFNFSDKLFFMNNWNLNDFFFNNFIWNNFLSNLYYVNISFFSVSNESWNLSIQIDSLSIYDDVRNFLLNLNISVPFKQFFIYHLDLFDFLFDFSEIDRFLYNFFNLYVLFLSWNFNRFFDFNNFWNFNNNFSIIFNLNYFFLI